MNSAHGFGAQRPSAAIGPGKPQDDTAPGYGALVLLRNCLLHVTPPCRRFFLLLLEFSCEHALKIRDGALQSGLERDARLPVEALACAGNIGAALPRIIRGQRPIFQPGARTG